MLVNAATGSSKNVVPNRLIAASWAFSGSRSVCASATRNETFERRLRVSRARYAKHRVGDVDADHGAGLGHRLCSVEGGGAAATADVEDLLTGMHVGGTKKCDGDGRHGDVTAVGVDDPALSAFTVPHVALGLIGGSAHRPTLSLARIAAAMPRRRPIANSLRDADRKTSLPAVVRGWTGGSERPRCSRSLRVRYHACGGARETVAMSLGHGSSFGPNVMYCPPPAIPPGCGMAATTVSGSPALELGRHVSDDGTCGFVPVLTVASVA